MRKVWLSCLFIIIMSSAAYSYNLTIVGGYDTSIYNTDADSCNGQSAVFSIKTSWSALIKFDVSGIPNGSLITEATQSVYRSGGGLVSKNVTAHEILHNWNEGIGCGDFGLTNDAAKNGTTYYERWFGNNVNDGNSPWDDSDPDWASSGMNGTDYNITVIDYKVPINGWNHFDWTNITKLWVAGKSNYGVTYRTADSATSTFRSSDYTSSSYFPYLTITYYLSEFNFTNPKNGSLFKINDYFTANITVTDMIGLSYLTFSTNNSGSWINDTPFDVSNFTSYRYNNSKLLTRAYQTNVCWRVYANDSYGNRSNSSTYCFNTINTVPTIASAYINNTDADETVDISCVNGTTADNDNHTLIIYYNWNKNGAWQDINSRNLSESLYSNGDNVYCKLAVGDSYDNSSWITSGSILIGGNKKQPFINSTNATTNWINNSEQYPANNNSYVNLTAFMSDNNTDDLHTWFFCSINNFNVTTKNCSYANGGYALCTSLANQSGNVSTCTFTDFREITASTFTYYAFVMDNSSLWSNSKLGSFYVNHPPVAPTILTSNHSFSNKNWMLLEFSTFDTDGDLLNYTFYGSGSKLYENISGNFNWTGLSEGIYNYVVGADDIHNYYSDNSSTYDFVIDMTSPSLSIVYPVNGSAYSSSVLDLLFNVSDTYIESCYYTIEGSIVGLTNYTNSSTVMNCSNTTIDLLGYADQTYTLRLYAEDNATNINSTSVTFSIYTPEPTGAGGGGGGGVQCTRNETCVLLYGNLYMCANGACVLSSSLLPKKVRCGNNICDIESEDFLSCSQDCTFDFKKDILCEDPNTPCFWKNRYFLIVTLFLMVFIGIYLFIGRQNG